ncbi:MAG TPA: hypothetical protein VLD63_00635 [Anaerolineales bacterium]|nr:hypothetical protein [Anaerolineales bacterium]
MRDPWRVAGWLGILLGAGFALAAAPALVRVPASSQVFRIDAPWGGQVVQLHLRLDRPEWIRAGAQDLLRLEVERVDDAGAAWPRAAGTSAAALVARFEAAGLRVLSGEEQIAPVAADARRFTFDWHLAAGDAGVLPGSLSLSARRYLDDGGTDESIVWAHFVSLEVRRPTVSAAVGFLGAAGGVALWLITRRRTRA